MRVKIDFPETSLFSTDIAITISDINYGGHLGNDRFLSIMQEARLRWLQAKGFKDEKEIDPPIGIIVVDAAIQYRAEVFHGEHLDVKLAIENQSSKGFDLLYQLKKEDETIAAIGKTGILCFNYETRKVSAIPERLIGHLR